MGAGRGYDTRGFVRECRKSRVTPHVAQKQRSTIDRRTTRHDGYRLSQRARKRVEEVFGWVKTVGGGRKLRYCGVARNRFWMELTTASYNLVRLSKLTPVSTQNLGQVCPDHPQSTTWASQSPRYQRQAARRPNELYVHTEPYDPSLPTLHPTTPHFNTLLDARCAA